jgi:hypothetical protein
MEHAALQESGQRNVGDMKAEDTAFTSAELHQAVQAQSDEKSALTRAELEHARRARGDWLKKLRYAQAVMSTATTPSPPPAPSGFTMPNGLPPKKVDPVVAAQLADDNAAKEVLRTEDAYMKVVKALSTMEQNARSLGQKKVAAKREVDTVDTKREQLKEQLVLAQETGNDRAKSLTRVNTRGAVEKERENAQLANLRAAAGQAKQRTIAEQKKQTEVKAAAAHMKWHAQHMMQEEEVDLARKKVLAHADAMQAEHAQAELKQARVRYSTLEERSDAEVSAHRQEVMGEIEDAQRVAHRYKKIELHKQEDMESVQAMLAHYRSELQRRRLHLHDITLNFEGTLQNSNRTVSQAEKARQDAKQLAMEIVKKKKIVEADKEKTDRVLTGNLRLTRAKQKSKAAMLALSVAQQDATKAAALKAKIGLLKSEVHLAEGELKQAKSAVEKSKLAVQRAKAEHSSAKDVLKVAEESVTAADASEVRVKKQVNVASVTEKSLSKKFTAKFKEMRSEVATQSKKIQAAADREEEIDEGAQIEEESRRPWQTSTTEMA